MNESPTEPTSAPESPVETADVPTVPEPTPPPTCVAFGSMDVWMVLSIVLLPSIVTGFTDVIWPITVPNSPPIAYYELRSLSALIGELMLILFLIRVSGGTFAQFGLGRPRVWIDLGWCVLLLIAAMQVCTALADFVAHMPGMEPDRNFGYPEPPSRPFDTAWLIVGCMAVGLVEELIWRGYLLTRIEMISGSTGQAVFWTTITFGLAHLYQGPGGVIVTGGFGLLFGLAFVWLRRIWPLALAHGIYDVMVSV